jgi:phosphoglycolate phosphatase
MPDFKYKHIIWDWNGTLFDDVWLCLEIINGILRQRNLAQLTPDRYRQIFDFPVINYYRKLGFDFSTDPFSAISTEFILEYERRRPACRLRAGALQILERNLEQGLTQSILSASKQSYLRQAVEELQISDRFVAVVGLDDHHATGKVELGRRLLKQLNLPTGQILLIGDTSHDYEVAQTMGVDCCLISGGHQAEQRLLTCGVPVLDSLAALHDEYFVQIPFSQSGQ